MVGFRLGGHHARISLWVLAETVDNVNHAISHANSALYETAVLRGMAPWLGPRILGEPW